MRFIKLATATATMTFQWSPGSVCVAASAQKVGERLQELEKAQGGRPITPQVVVDDARSKRSPLHECFEWDDSIAAEQHRLSQARHVMSHIRVVQADSTEPRHLFVNVTPVDVERGYMSVSKVLSDAELFAQVLDRAERDLESFAKRYEEFSLINEIGRDALEVLRARRKQ
jgi:hypothetical protein